MFSRKEKPIIATVPGGGWLNDDGTPYVPSASITEAQGERIIQLLEQLVANTAPSPLAPAFPGALDEEIAEDIKRHSISYPGGC